MIFLAGKYVLAKATITDTTKIIIKLDNGNSNSIGN
jgi:hypothetical protein